MASNEQDISDEIIIDTVDEEREEAPVRRRGGSKKGRRFQKVKRAPGEPLIRSFYRLRQWEKDVMREVGGGNETTGLRKLVDQAARMLERGPYAK